VIRLRRGSILGLAALLATACGGDAPLRGGSLVVALRADVDSWNPYTSQDATSAAVLESVYPRLVQEVGLNGASSRFDAWLASSWTFSPDRLTLTFQLRTDARWSDGTAVTCDDVQFTWQAQTSPELGWPGESLKRRISSVDCRDEHTAVFRFTSAYADQLVDANDNAIVPRAYATVPFKDWKSFAWPPRMISCGPFRLASLSPGQEVVLERDPHWWGAADVPLDRVVFRVQPQAAAAFERLLEGEVDVLPKVPPLRAAELQGGTAPRLAEFPSLSFTYIGWNTLDPRAYAEGRKAPGWMESPDDLAGLRRDHPHPILSDPRVRRALTLAIDRRDLIDGIWSGHALVGDTPVVACLWAHEPSTPLPFDPERAMALLEDAGWRDTDGDGVRERGGIPLAIRVIVNAENQTRKDALDRAAASLARVGVRLVPDPLPRGEFGERARDKNFDAVLAGWSAGTRVEPQNLLSARAAVARGYNFTSWFTPASDTLMSRAADSATREEALPLWAAWQQLFRDEQPLTILFEERTLVGLGARVGWADPSVLSPFQNIHRWWLKPSPEPAR